MCENEYLNGKIIKKREFEKIKKNIFNDYY